VNGRGEFEEANVSGGRVMEGGVKEVVDEDSDKRNGDRTTDACEHYGACDRCIAHRHIVAKLGVMILMRHCDSHRQELEVGDGVGMYS